MAGRKRPSRGGGYSARSTSASSQLNQRVSEISDSILLISTNIAALTVRAAQNEKTLDELRIVVAEVKEEVGSIVNLTNRWRGGFVALAALGGILGWLISAWEHVVIIWHGIIGSAIK